MMRVTYLGHSGFLLEMENIYCLFDYYKGEFPEWDRDKKMVVFVSHAHYDHFGKEIFQLRENFSEICYILSSDIEPSEYVHVCPSPCSDIISMGPNEEKDVFGIKVRTLRSNDQGVAYLLHCGGRTIYHAGDLNWWHWEEESEVFNKMIRRTYQSEINKLQHEKIDIAFVPVDPRLGEQYCLGIDCFMKRTDTKYVFPMHFWGNYDIFDRLMLEKCTETYKDKIMKIEREGQTFLIEA